MPATTAAPMSFREVLGITVMRRIWLAQVVSLFGDFVALFAVISVVSFTLNGTPAEVTGVQIAYMLPFAAIGPIAGVFVDRWSLKRTLVGSDLIRAGLVVMLMFAPSIWHLYAILVTLSAVSTFFHPAQSLAIRTYVPREGLLSANALIQLAATGSRIVGPATAGAIVAAFGAAVCYVIDGVSFLVSAALIASVPVLERPVAAPATTVDAHPLRRVWLDLIEGVDYIVRHRALSFVVISMSAGLFTIGCFGPLIAVFVRESLHGGSEVFGVVSGTIGAGLLAGTLVLRAIARRFSNEGMVLSGLAGIGAAVFLLGAVPQVAAAVAAVFTLGFAFAAIIIPAQTLMQQETPPHLMGRISSTMMSVMFFAQVLGLAVSGVLGQLLGVRAVFFLCAALAAALAAAGHWLLKGRRG